MDIRDHIKVVRQGHLGGSVGWASDLSSGHDLTPGEFEPPVGLCADSSELRAQSLEPASDSASVFLPLPCLLSVPPTPIQNINIRKKIVLSCQVKDDDIVLMYYLKSK